MEGTIFDFVSAKNIMEYWINKNVNRQPLLGETLFPYTREIGTEIEFIKGAKNQPVALRLSAYDAKAIRRNREGFDKYKQDMPFFKESMYIDEKLRQLLNNFMNANSQALVDSILSKIFDDQIKLIDASFISLERMRMSALTTGVVSLSSNGQTYSIDYGVPSEHKKTVTTDWSDASADIIGDVQAIVDSMREEGVIITRAVCNSKVAKYFRTNTAIKNAVYVFANGTVTVGQARAIDYIRQETGVQFLVYDNVYVKEDGSASKYIPDETVVFMPEGTLGETHMGVTPEESDLQNKLNADVAVTAEGVAITTYGTEDPVNVEMKVSMVGAPSFEKADEIYILDTQK